MSGDVSRDWDVTSFDGTVIRAHWFPIENLATGETAPTILMGPGWGSGGDTDVDQVGLLGSLVDHDASRRRVQRAHVGPAWLGRVDRDRAGRQRRLRSA